MAMTLGEACDAFLRYCEGVRKLSAHTVRAYRLDLCGFAEFAGTITDIGTLDRAILHGYVEQMFSVSRLKETSVQRHLASARSLFRWLEEEGLLSEDPFHRTRIRIRLPKRLPRILSRDELASLLRSAWVTSFTDITAQVAVEILFATGIRVAELVALRDDDIDLVAGAITITGKGDLQRNVFIPDADVKEVVTRYRDARTTEGFAAATFLVNSQGRPATPEFVRRVLQRRAHAANVTRRVTPHMFRHSCATYLLEEGLDIRYVQRLLGHRSIGTTEIYTHVADATLKIQVTQRHPRKAIVASRDVTRGDGAASERRPRRVSKAVAASRHRK